MSFNRENVTWQSKDGTWNLGFFTVAWEGDGDPEWDVEYDKSSFGWVTHGHATERAASDAWDGANPGGSWVYRWSEDARERIEELDAMRDALRNRCKKARSPW